MMARRFILMLVGLAALSAGWLLSTDGLAREMRGGEGAWVEGAQAPRFDPQAAQAYPAPQETPSPYPPTSQAIPLISVVLLGALLVIFVVGVCLRYCLRRGR